MMSRKGWTAMLLLAAGTALAAPEAGSLPMGLYPLDTCQVTGQKLGPEAVIYEHQGRELRFASKDCIAAFMKDPAAVLAKVDEAIIRQQLPGYPLATCLVSGDAFGGEMGEPIHKVYQNRLVRFCCKDCLAPFEKDPARFLAKLDAAVIAKEKPAYPLDVCAVSDEKLGGEMGEPVDYVFNQHLVRFCCKGCFKDFRKDPLKVMARIDAAAKPGKKGASEGAKKPEAKGHEGHGHEHGH